MNFWAVDQSAPPPGNVPGLTFQGGQWKNQWGNAVDVYGGSAHVLPTGEGKYMLNGVEVPDPNYHPAAYKAATGYDPPAGAAAPANPQVGVQQGMDPAYAGGLDPAAALALYDSSARSLAAFLGQTPTEEQLGIPTTVSTRADITAQLRKLGLLR